MPEVSGTETGCLKAGLRPRWNTSLLAAGVLEAALWYWRAFIYLFYFFHVVVPIRTSADLLCCGAGRGPCRRAGGQEGARAAISSCSVLSPLGHGLCSWGGAKHRALRPTSSSVKMVPSGSVVPAPLGSPEMSPRALCCHLRPCRAWPCRWQWQWQLSQRLSPPRDSVRPARAGMHLQHGLVSVPKTVSQEYGSGRCFLRGLSREMQRVAAGPGELGSPCEPHGCEELWQAQEDAALDISMRQKGEARITVNKRLQTVFKVPPASNRAECLACVCLAPFFSKLWKCCWKLIFFLFFFSSPPPPPTLFFPPYFLFLHMDAGRKQDSGESRELPGTGLPGKAAGSSAAANPDVFAASPFCTHCLLPGAWSSSP